MEFVDVLVRQAHPGPDVPPYQTPQEKHRDARRYKADEDIPWTVLVDDIAGTTHQVYGGLADPIYLIDVNGHVAFYNMWAHAPTLHQAIQCLMDQGGAGVANGGVDRTPHLGASLTDGWKAIRRGLPQSYADLETAAPGMGAATWLGWQLRPLLKPVTLSAAPMRPATKAALALGIAAAAVLIVGARRADRRG